MAFYTIEKRVTASGDTRYRCVVGIKEGGAYTHRESKTFARSALAKSWGALRVAELESGAPIKKAAGITLRALIRRYLSDVTIRKGRSKIKSLEAVSASTLGDVELSSLTMARYIEYARVRRYAITGSSLATELSYIKTVLDVAWPFYEVKAMPEELNYARIYMKRQGITAPSRKRTRRPTRQEFNDLHAGLINSFKRSRKGIRYHDVFEFAVYSCMRRGEIVRIEWDDIDHKTKSVLVRDRKDPRKKEGNHMIVPLLGRAWELVMAQPKTCERIFPYNAQTITMEFKDVKEKLNIPDIRLHDMRREAASRLFEMGFTIEEVAQVTGHKNLKTLWTVYREIYPETLHDRFDELTARLPRN